jgi:prefoldin subunit 5
MIYIYILGLVLLMTTVVSRLKRRIKKLEGSQFISEDAIDELYSKVEDLELVKK